MLAAPTENPKELTGRQKPIMATIPPVAEALQCAVHEHGHGRHGEWNWRETPINLTTYIKAVGRHLAAVLDGEWLDPDSGYPHFSHIACGTNIVIDALSLGKLVNDLPPPGMGANLVAAIEATKTLPPKAAR